MKFITEMYPDLEFCDKEGVEGNIYFGFERSKYKYVTKTKDYVFIKKGCEYNVKSWMYGEETTFYTPAQLNEFEYMITQSDIEELYQELEKEHKELLLQQGIHSFHQFGKVDQLPEKIQSFVLHFLQEMNVKHKKLTEETWEGAYELPDGSTTKLLIFHEGDYIISDFDALVTKLGVIETNDFTSTYFLGTRGSIYQMRHSHCKQDIEHYITILKKIEDETEKQVILKLFSKEKELL